MSEHDTDYAVGYRRPPRSSQFKPGRSGNPAGRRKGKRGLKTDLAEALDATNAIENKLTGKVMKGTNQRLAMQTLVMRAAAGDLKAQALLLPMIVQVLGTEDRGAGPRKLSAHDQAILDEVLASRGTDTAPDSSFFETPPATEEYPDA